jgi:glycosyltransferase involved in cell wall biosynthesis
VPYLNDLSQPADRRRFPFFAKNNHIKFEIADQNKKYDVILLTAFADLSKWLIYKKKNPGTRYIFEMVDSLIFYQTLFETLFKGIGKYMMRKESALHLNYRNILIKWIKEADLVICSSNATKENIEQWNKNVVVSLDYMQNEVIRRKTDYTIDGKMKLVWEGQGVVCQHLLHYKELFKRINSFCNLYIITDENYSKYGGLTQKSISTIIDQLPITTFFHKWEIYKNFEMLIQYDCGIIPLNKSNKMALNKPANKLISFSFAGLPTVVTDTPAYVEFMNGAGTNLYCSNVDEWVSALQKIKTISAEERQAIASKNLNYVIKNYSNQALDLSWYRIFEKLEQDHSV